MTMEESGSEQGHPERIRGFSRRTIHRGVKFGLEMVGWMNGRGETVEREVVRHLGSVVVLPLLDDGRVVMIRNFRVSVERELLELPAGTREPGEEPGVCAVRELEEETGYTAATMEILCRFHLSPGMTDERMHGFVARGLRPSVQRLEIDEAIRPTIMSIPEVLGRMDSGEIEDAKTIAVVLLAVRKGVLR